jgi:putative lipoic acid-binding regulatory protein
LKFTEITTDQESLLEFPCEFSIKAMGLNEPGFQELVVQIVRKHCPDLGEACSRTRPSKNGKWLSVTVDIQASSRDQLDAIYMDLTAHEKVTMSL